MHYKAILCLITLTCSQPKLMATQFFSVRKISLNFCVWWTIFFWSNYITKNRCHHKFIKSFQFFKICHQQITWIYSQTESLLRSSFSLYLCPFGIFLKSMNRCFALQYVSCLEQTRDEASAWKVNNNRWAIKLNVYLQLASGHILLETWSMLCVLIKSL